MSETATRTVFITQSRVASDTKTDPWNDTCNGHEDFYTAVTCHETTKAAISGEDTSPAAQKLSAFVKHSLSHCGPNVRMELRVVRRTVTVTDEVVDGVGAETAEASHVQ